jgi:outer membrane receptor protein involved in Fe transport
MNYENEISLAVRRALLTGAAVAAGSAVAQTALAQEEQASEPAVDEGEQTVVVTGTRIRRVDAETASPVFVIDKEAIAQSGVRTIGDLVQQIPSISGAATNPQVNNGGGNGDSNIELRGLDPARTLVLLNGRRVGILGQDTGAVDVNIIPLNLIERVDVLKEGAGAVYGSDAIAGVVNFITKQDFEGFEGNVQFGETDRSDGKNQKYDLTFGLNGDKGNLVVGGSFDHQDSVSAGARKFSRYATYFYGSVFNGGSSRNVTGRIDLPSTLPASMQQYAGCESGSITRQEGASGASPDDYRCFISSGQVNDFYNFQPVNLLMTPQDRGTLFLLGHYDINDKVSFFSEVLYNRTHSGFQIASLPFTSRSDNVVISGESMYNPFGVDFGGITTGNPNAQWRMVALGGRRNEVTTNSARVVTGLRGNLFSSDWQWEGSAQMGRMDQNIVTRGYLYQSLLEQAFGPSFEDPITGAPTCGTPGNVIEGCTPVDIFNLDAPGQADALKTISADSNSEWVYKSRGVSLSTNGDLFQLPAGAMQAAVGFEYQKLEGDFDTDFLTTSEAPLFLTCQLASETCTADSKGHYNVKEGYAEVHVPVLKDMPAIQALDLTAGIRYSDYSLFGNTTNSMFKLEYRPIKDALFRASFSEVFRVPTIYNLYQGTTHDAPVFQDPCNGLTPALVAANPNLTAACPGVALDGSYGADNGQVEAVRVGTSTLKPETGHVWTYGVVYDPSWLSGLSLNLDFWRYKLDGLITRVDAQFTSDQCVATADPFFCGLITRYTSGDGAGQVLVAQEPWLNLGTLKTNGVDFGIKYTLRNTVSGSWRFSLDTTYTDAYKNKASPISETVDYAGTYSTTFGNYAKYRSLLAVGWSMGSFDGLLTGRYIHKLTIPDSDGAPGPDVPLHVPHRTYFNLTLGYELPTNTKIQLGVINLTDEEPPVMYFNNTLNANTDVSTYDTLGRQYFISVRQRF